MERHSLHGMSLSSWNVTLFTVHPKLSRLVARPCLMHPHAKGNFNVLCPLPHWSPHAPPSRGHAIFPCSFTTIVQDKYIFKIYQNMGLFIFPLEVRESQKLTKVERWSESGERGTDGGVGGESTFLLIKWVKCWLPLPGICDDLFQMMLDSSSWLSL